MKMSRGCKIQLSGVGVCLFILSAVCLFVFSGSSFANDAQGVSSDGSAVVGQSNPTPVGNHPDHPDRPDRPDRPDHPDHPDEHPDHPDSPDRPDRPDHPDHP